MLAMAYNSPLEADCRIRRAGSTQVIPVHTARLLPHLKDEFDEANPDENGVLVIEVSSASKPPINCFPKRCSLSVAHVLATLMTAGRRRRLGGVRGDALRQLPRRVPRKLWR
jgi:hypothetical protein